MAISRSGRCALMLSLSAAVILGATGAWSATQTSTFVIAAAQGYGVEDCLAEGGECGRVVADAWCEANGRHGAVSFGRSGTTERGGDAIDGRPYFITCGD